MNFGCAKTHRIIEIDALMAHLGTSWGPLETPWNHLGDPWGLLGAILGPLGSPWGDLGDPLGKQFSDVQKHIVLLISDALRDRYLREVRFANLVFFRVRPPEV